MAAFALTAQISELDNFDLDVSFQQFIQETQEKLLSTPAVQTEEEPNVQTTYDLSSFMSTNFETREQQTGDVVGNTIEAFVEDQLANQVVKGLGHAIFGTEQLLPQEEKELLFENMAEEDAATAVVYQDTKFSEQELVCLEVLEGGFKFQQPHNEGFIEENYNYSEHAFSYSQDGVTVTKKPWPTNRL